MSEHAMIETGDLPFEPMEPDYDRETIEAMREALDIASGRIQSKTYTDADELSGSWMTLVTIRIRLRPLMKHGADIDTPRMCS